MELLAIFWIAYVIYIATRTPERQQNHALMLWAIMIGGTILSVGYQLLK